jgi:hypothetical protein
VAARILAYYTLAVAAAWALFILSVVLWLLLYPPLWAYVPLYLMYAAWVLLSGGLVAAFLWGYMRYAIAEWGDFAPQGANLMVLFTVAYAVMYMALMAYLVCRPGTLNLAVWAAFIASVGAFIYLMRGGMHVTSGALLLDLASGARLLPLALAVGLPLAWIFIAGYEGVRMVVRGARLAGLSVLLSILCIFFAPLFLLDVQYATAALALIPLQYTGIEVLTWPGIIAWEELTSRFLLPAVGPLANYMFVALHAPTRWLAALFLAPAILAVISMGARWITDVYRRHGLIGAISAHSVYNGMIGWLIGLIYFPLLTVATLIALAVAYMYYSARAA